MESPKEYEINTFNRLCNAVNEENAERLAVDLAQWLVWYSLVIKEYRDKYPEKTKGKTNTQITKASFRWVDDGRNDVLAVTLVNKDTGEITKVDSPSKDDAEPRSPHCCCDTDLVCSIHFKGD